MDAVRTVTGTICPIDANDVDTDQIIPKQYLKRIERTGFGPYAFAEWRYREDGTPDPDFPMNQPAHADASILLAGRNFGSGSSREHAPWAIEDAGFHAVIAESFADIFRNNCGNVGIIAVQLDHDTVRELFEMVDRDPSTEVTVDLETQTVTGGGLEVDFTIDAHTRHKLLNGLDDVALSLQRADDIAAFEDRRASWMPRLA
ncbi:3-isopropylmalate dehydratase small subunit [Salsipaludibacter albus]|uniref:3-isopropylmalate dehydratase small subunit n=1 Tax=Salsipaludibacter albus TaxID=2849650 RepID=UPI001EE4986E|nr:3-isopropylmalate dehydratase small subunit [Salsipaludibacter albus]MBY5162307.1 3-isopropylmalate dehydratase small subunit [Salsipaludibacter albus]